MIAEPNRKPSTEPARSPVENARLLLPQLTAGQRAVVGALIAECERLKGDPLVDVYALNNTLRDMVRDFRADLAIARETAEYHGERYAECKDELARVRGELKAALGLVVEHHAVGCFGEPDPRRLGSTCPVCAKRCPPELRERMGLYDARAPTGEVSNG